MITDKNTKLLKIEKFWMNSHRFTNSKKHNNDTSCLEIWLKLIQLIF